MEKENTNLTLRKDIKEAANKTVDAGTFPGFSSLSSLVELALVELMKTKADFLKSKGVPIPGVEPEGEA